MFCHGCVEWLPVVGGGGAVNCTSYMITQTLALLTELAYVCERLPHEPVPGGAHETQVEPLVGYTPSREVDGGGEGLAMPVPSPQSMAKPTCFFEFDFDTQPSHFHVPETVTVRPAVVVEMDMGYGVSS